MTRNIPAILLITAMSMSSGCDRESNPTCPGNVQHLSRIEAQVLANCLTVQAAAEEFAFQNDLVYPGGWGDCTRMGETLCDLLPGGVLLKNPVILCRIEPSVWGGDPWCPGQTSIEPIQAFGLNVGYTIQGIGEESGDVISTITSVHSRYEAEILAQCFLLESDGLLYYMQNKDDEYPRDIDTDVNLEGKTVLDYVSDIWGGMGRTNVLTGELSEPRNGTASDPGSIGYSPVMDGDVVVGCIITAAGERPGDLIVNREGLSGYDLNVHAGCHYLEQALLTFAWRNDMIFPDDLNGDADLTGRTLAEYYPNAYGAFYNQYTGIHSNPVMGTADAAGEVAYTPVSMDGVNSGYIITGVGKYPGHIIVRHEYGLSEADKSIYYTGAVLRTAAEEFAERNGGVYAVDFDKDENLDSHTILNLLPSIRLLVNPVSSRRTGIINGRASYPGETGYVGWGTGYSITSINEAGYYIIDYNRRTTQ